MKYLMPAWILLLSCGCDSGPVPTVEESPAPVLRTLAPAGQTTLAEARRGFVTNLQRRESAGVPVTAPPANSARIVHYESPVGQLAAYLTAPPSDGKKHPAIIWISGGDYNTIDAGFFDDAPRENDQTASAFRKAGIITMYPSLRGGNDNPGVRESFFGEVDDVMAALDFLQRQDFVDPNRIYLAGHSTGATLVLLVAASTDRFRAIYSFGPASDITGYGSESLPFDLSNSRELELRTPARWMHAVRTPTFVFEGMEEPSNLGSLDVLSRSTQNPFVHYHPVRGADHFSILAPVTEMVAERIQRDQGPATEMHFDEAELNGLFAG